MTATEHHDRRSLSGAQAEDRPRRSSPSGPAEGSQPLFGTVRTFNISSGFGFIAPDTGGRDLFVHQSQIQATGFRALVPGQRVSYVIGTTKKGQAARNVRPL